jgi:DNA-binding XRE family transcriptional regulator
MATVGNARTGRPRAVPLCPWGELVESLAARKRLGRPELAQRIGISEPSLWALLVGKSKPKFETACRLADVLGVPVTRLRS